MLALRTCGEGGAGAGLAVQADKFIEADGTTLAYAEVGAGHPVIALHGFPDIYKTWSGLAGPLADAGFRVIAVAMRGYAPSAVPADGDYSLRRLALDTLCLLDALEIERASVVGHDWGASAGYALAALAPQRLASLVTLAIPPLTVFPSGLREGLARPHNLYLGFGALSDWWLRRADFAEVQRLYRKWSPRWAVPEAQLAEVTTALAPPERSRAAVDYYRAGMREADRRAILRPVTTPTLMLYGADEPQVRQASYAQAAAVTGPGSRVVRLEGVGHWPHLEAPDRCRAEILAFLRERSGGR